jgi:hypothetical protein
VLLLFILTANGFLPGGSSTTIRHITQVTHTSHKITHHTQKNTAHKTTQTIKDTLHTMNTMQIQLQIQQIQLQLQLYKLILIKKQAYCTLNSNSNGICNVMF